MNLGVQRLTHMPTKELVKLLLEIDNGLMDDFLEKNERYNEMDYYRKQIINILMGRYLFFRENPGRVHEEEKEELNDSYKLFLHYYI